MDIQKLCIWTPACVRGAMEWALEFRFQKEACSWLKAFAVRAWDPAGNRPVSLAAGCGGGVLLAAWVLPVLMSGEPLIRFQKRSLALRMRR
jgi:hypothetical protein